nr:CHAP domain-containing protein [Streptococcus anginosus]
RLVSAANAQAGDLVCFDWDGDGVADHVGFVERNYGSYYQTIEGNTSSGASGSQSNGGGVYRRTRNLGSVIAVIRPEYTGDSSSWELEEDGIW